MKRETYTAKETKERFDKLLRAAMKTKPLALKDVRTKKKKRPLKTLRDRLQIED